MTSPLCRRLSTDGARHSRASSFLAAAFRLSLACSLLLLVACDVPGGPSAPQATPVRVSQQAAQRLQAKVEQIVVSPRPDFTLEITEEEATSYLALNLPQSPISDAEVRFLDGRVRLVAKVAYLLNLQVVTTWSAQVVSAQVRIKIENATVACLPLPTQLLDSLSETLNQMILESQINIQITAIQITPGKAVVSGTKTR